jgi:hypothetical protein
MVRKATTMILAGPEAEDTEAEVILEEEAISAATTVVTSTASMAITPTADIVAITATADIGATPTPRAIPTWGLRTVTNRNDAVSATDASAIDEHSAI